MALITCPECKNFPVSNEAILCPTCGYPIAEKLNKTAAENRQIEDLKASWREKGLCLDCGGRLVKFTDVTGDLKSRCNSCLKIWGGWKYDW